MHNPGENKLRKYVQTSGESEVLDRHAWLHGLTGSEKEQLSSEVLNAGSMGKLSDYARQFYIHFCTSTDNAELREIERGFVMSQIEERPEEEITRFEDMYFKRAKKLMQLKENLNHEN